MDGGLIGFPSNDLQVKHEDAVKNRHQEQSDKGSDAKSTDLRVTKRLPQRTAFESKREKSQDRCSHCDHYRANSLDARIGQRLDQWLALCVHFLDEVEQHDDVADNHADQAGDAEKSHEPKRRVHDREGDQGADHAIRSSSEYQKRFDGVIELNEQGQVNPNQRAKIYAQSLDGGDPTLLLATQSRAIAVPDYLLFAQDQNLFTQRMDWKAVRKVGEPLLLAPNVAASPAYLGTSEFTASQNGVLIYGTATGSSFDQFNWYARDGALIGSFEPVIDFQQFTLSPDGKHLALNSFHQHATGSLWLIDLTSNTTTPLTTDPHAQSDPVWSPDSRYVAFNLLPNGGSDPPFLVQKIEIGTQQSQPIYGDHERHWVEDWSPDGSFLLTHDTKTFSIIPVTGNSKPKTLYSSRSVKDEFHLSPDGQVIAYGDNRTGTWEVFVASFPSFHDIKQVSWQAASSRVGAETAGSFSS